MTSPRATSISSCSVSVTASPATDTSRSPSAVTIRATRDCLPEAATTTWSPAAMRPEATVPEKPRKSRFGRFTHCTGKRNGFSAASDSMSTASRCSTSVGPCYQGVLPDFTVTLSP
jgi:hypothetical protein